MARTPYWDRVHTTATGGAYTNKGNKGLISYAAGNTLTRSLWTASFSGETEFAPGPIEPFQVAVGIYERPTGSGLSLFPIDQIDAGEWVSRATVTMRTLYWTFDPAGALLGGQRIGDTGDQDVESKAQRVSQVGSTDLVFAWQVDSRSDSAGLTVTWSLVAAFSILIG